jgi:hypothetical protein
MIAQNSAEAWVKAVAKSIAAQGFDPRGDFLAAYAAHLGPDLTSYSRVWDATFGFLAGWLAALECQTPAKVTRTAVRAMAPAQEWVDYAA